jgi:tetratricopeptide (TPR) repeat protein
VLHPLLVRSCSLLLLSPWLFAQSTGPAGEDVRKAFVDADGARRLVVAAAADKLIAADAAGRAWFVGTLRAIAAVAPAAAAPAPSTGTPPKPPEYADDVRQRMNAAVGADAALQKAAIEALAADKEAGARALQQLDERGRKILERAVTTIVRRKLETNAIFAGQYRELRDFHPEGSDLLLRWAKEAPREVTNPDAFRTACLRALRDTLAPEHATDRVRADLKDIAGKAQSGRSQDLFMNAICALREYGDAAAFDEIRGGLEKQLTEASPDSELQVTEALANLLYTARLHGEAARHYKTIVQRLEARPEPTPGFATTIYNTACNLALAGQIDEAFIYLEKALAAGKKAGQPLGKALVDTDHDIDALRKDPRFQPLYEQYFGKPQAPR